MTVFNLPCALLTIQLHHPAQQLIPRYGTASAKALCDVTNYSSEECTSLGCGCIRPFDPNGWFNHPLKHLCMLILWRYLQSFTGLNLVTVAATSAVATVHLQFKILKLSTRCRCKREKRSQFFLQQHADRQQGSVFCAALHVTWLQKN